ncbi:PIN domain-like protein [Dentipellis sp. KUC8613]|nr:PIN domain-like protein [Dentipellis sp. KUC8613]
MGVHGLTTYLREHQRLLATSLVLSNSPSNTQPPVALVIDGWSFIYTLYLQSRLPWAFGGEYRAFHALIVRVVQAWLKVGFRPYFVFDGPYPSAKFNTVVNRVTQGTIHSTLLFYRTSATSRASPRFLREISMLPPLSYAVCLQALSSPEFRDLVEVHIADEEGDPFSVELAGRVGGYVTGNDSDFLVLNTDGYAGYIPMEEIVWTTLQDSQSSSTVDDDGFTVARRSKGAKAAADTRNSEHGLLIPEGNGELSATCTVYKPSALAAHFKLPISLLPLLGALVGNDFIADRRSMHDLFFERGLTLSQRITRVATALQTNLAATVAAPKRRPKQQITGVMDLIGLTVDSLLVRPASTMASGEREAVIEKIAEATLQYALPKYDKDSARLWPTEVCPLHLPEQCLIPALLSPPLSSDGADDEQTRAQIQALYIAAYRRGKLHPRILDIFSTATSWCNPFLEDPDMEPVTKSIGRPIREWIYAILDDGIGLPEREQETLNTTEDGSQKLGYSEGGESDDDELIDVIEEDSEEEDVDPLAPLRGALQELRPGEGTETDAGTSVASHTLSSQKGSNKIVMEFLRRGTRLAPEEVIVPSLSSLLSSIGINHDASRHVPVQLQPESERLSLFLRILGSDVPAVASVPPEQLMAVVALRTVVHRLHIRATTNGYNKDRDRERWTQSEAQAFLAAFRWPSSETPGQEEDDSPFPPLENRNIQLLAQITEALKTIANLAEVMLLADHLPSPAAFFSGRQFHQLLTEGRSTNAGGEPPNALWEACAQGLEDAFGEAKGKKGKKERKARNAQVPSAKANTSSAPSQGLFGILAGMDIDDSA